MTNKERFIATVLFDKPDKVPFWPGGARESTLKMWHKQGLPEGEDWFSCIAKKLGIEAERIYADMMPEINFTMIPEFEEKLIEQKERTQIVQDWKGNICEIPNKYDVSYLRNPKDFVTRRWIKCPVESWKDWEQMKARYDADDPRRTLLNFEKDCELINKQDRLVVMEVSGVFWQLREWMGFENLCIAFIEKPNLIHDMIKFYGDFVSKMLEKLLRYAKLDYILICEDMAYKQKTMISPAMIREFILPTWRQWGEIIHNAGCPLYHVDSDGYIGELMPLWIEAGFQVNEPVEIAAGNDLKTYQEAYGNSMAYMGGVDKRAIAKGGEAIIKQIEMLRPVVQRGGYIPICDHALPSDVSWPNMIEYCKLLAKLTGWL